MIGIQLFSLPKLLEQDFPKAIQLLSQMGYQEVELFGPYSFSDPAVIAEWKALAPMLGFSGSGFFGNSLSDVSTILKNNGLTVPSVHTDLITLQNSMPAFGEMAQVLGFKYVVLPAIPEEKRKTLEDYKYLADSFNQIGENAKKEGLKFAYHNHGYGLQEVEGQLPLQLLLDNTDPDLVFGELDIYWTTAGGIDPVSLLEAYPNRYHLMHLKDMKELVRFSGDGGNSMEWMQLFPYMTTAGDGVLDLPLLIQKGKELGVQHFLVEQDMVAEPAVALKHSFDYLAGII